MVAEGTIHTCLTPSKEVEMTKYLTEAKARGKARDLNRNLEAHDFTWSAIHYPGHGWLVQEVDAQGDPIA